MLQLNINYFTYLSSVPKWLQNDPDCYILFTVKDKDLMGKDYMGEGFLSFQHITRSNCAVEMENVNQIILPLTKPPEKGQILF